MSKTQMLEKIIHNSEVCACGKVHTSSLKTGLIEKGALEKLPTVIASLGDFKKVVMVCDENTYIAAGKRAEQICGFSKTVILDPNHLHATEVAVEIAEEKIGEADLLVAIGAGTIHDITRYVAHKMGIDFVSVPTAASVDGFVSGVAAMTWHGVKKTLPAVPPVALVADSDVIAKAPYYLTASGVGDLIGKYTSIFDWKVATIITGEYICSYIISLVMEAIDEVAANLDKIKAQNEDAIEALTYGLVLSGIAIQLTGNSRPASASEHHISHFIEMGTLYPENEALHGEKVGVAAGIVCDYYHKALARDITVDDLSDYDALPVENIRKIFKELSDDIINNENTPDPLLSIDRELLVEMWDDIRALAKEILPTGDALRDMLRRVGASVTLTDINIPEEDVSILAEYSPFTRARLTFMRLLKLIK